MVQTDVKMSNGRTRKSTKPYYLAEWQESFGPPLQTIVNKVNQDFMGYYVAENNEETDTKQLAVFDNDNK